MYEDELKRLWNKLEVSSEKFSSELTKFSYSLNGVIAALGENEKLIDLKNALENVQIEVSSYDPYGSTDKSIKVTMSSTFTSLEECGSHEYDMSTVQNIRKGTLKIILIVQDFEYALIKAESEYLPGGSSSFKHDGLAKKLLVALRNFKMALLVFANEEVY